MNPADAATNSEPETNTPDSIAIVIPAHNVGQTIGAQLSALADQVDAPAFTVVVVLNRCTDDTLAIVESFADRLDLRTIQANERAGASYARNVGTRSTTSTLVLHADGDDIVGPTWVREMAAALRSADLVGGMLVPPADSGRAWSPPQGLYGRNSLPMSRGVPYPVGCSMGYRRNLFDHVGGFDEEVVGGSEEIGLAVAARRAGFTIGYAPRAVTTYAPRYDRSSALRQRAGYGRSEVWMRARHTPEELGSPAHELSAVAARLLLAIPACFDVERDRRRRRMLLLAYRWGRLRGIVQVVSSRQWPRKTQRCAKDLSGQIVFDVSTLLVRVGHGVSGVERVQLAQVDALRSAHAGRLRFVATRPGHDRLRHVSSAELERTIAAIGGNESPEPLRPVRRELRWSSARSAAGDSSHRRRAAAVVASLGRLSAELRRTGGTVRVLVAGLASSTADRAGLTGSTCATATWGPDTVYVNTGVVHRDTELGPIKRAKEQRGARFVLMVHDTIPISQPQLNGSYSARLRAAIELADGYLVNSRHTAADLRAILSHDRRPIAQIPMSSPLHEVAPRRVAPPPGLEPQSFVLTVGTVTFRKNHHLLLDVWERLIAELDDETPPLVVAGRPGWLNAETMSRLRLTPELDQYVHVLEHLGDRELSWLYRNCRFSVFPSLYEGWGLPITESLDAGRVCLVSDRSSAPEAAAGLCPLLDPTDRDLWAQEIRSLWSDDLRRRDLEQRIAVHHTPVSVEQAATGFLRALDEVTARTASDGATNLRSPTSSSRPTR